ncbi:MAG: GIY-YIG nuclease family protein [Candidatus Paceibacterota bacterium]
MYYVYVLQSKKNKKWYTGYTSDLQKRFREHNDGRNKYTKGRGPFVLIYYEAYKEGDDARSREGQLKSGPGKAYLRRRIKHFLALSG